MAIYYNTSVVRNGLVLHYDPANTKSYNYSENLLTYSSQFENAAWIPLSGSTVSANTATAPDGTLTADVITSTSDTGVYQQNTITAGTSYTASIYLKLGGGTATSVMFRDMNGASLTGYHVVINTSNGTMSGSSVTAFGSTDAGNNWRRFWFTYTPDTTASQITVRPNSQSGSTTYTVWGAQLQRSPYLGNYIPTTTAAITPVTTYTDLSGQGNNAVTTGTVYEPYNQGSLVCTNYGTVTKFTTATDSLNLITSFSLNAWVKPTGTGFTTGQYYYVIAKNISGGYGDHQYAIEIPPGQNIELQIAGYTLVSPVVSWTTGTWYNISCTYDGSTATTYLNGEFLVNGGYTGGSAYKPYLRISGRSSTADGTGLAYPFPGNISAVQIYNRCLGANEIKQNFQALRDRFGV